MVRSIFQAELVNDPFGDPGAFVDFQFERRALLLDLGDLAALPPRKLLRVSHVFVSHTHMDHFAGFDHLLRLLLGRDKRLELFGPPGLIAAVRHKLGAYTWNLISGYDDELRFRVNEVGPSGISAAAEMSSRDAFRASSAAPAIHRPGVLVEEPELTVRFAVLDHQIPCLAFALEESVHLNVWKSRLSELGFEPGPWLQELKAAVLRGEPEDRLLTVRREGGGGEISLRLGKLRRQLLSTTPGQKIAYVVDAVFSPGNAEAIVRLAQGADLLFIESAFADADRERARERFHLTARQAGELARSAGVRRLVPMHFSPRYSDTPELLAGEAEEAFAGGSRS
ncbi:MAG TPA: MBL fold metallo-hydrolase [Thermoanaerobaculia bacterium]|nr:MBL fold metallo-hydrolase [Thermoanaerobaculia bacterium]